MLRYINAGQLDKVPAAMRQYNKAVDRHTGVEAVNDGLVNRRASEIGQWAKGAYVASASIDVAEPPRFDPRLKATATAIGTAVAGASTGIGAAISSAQAQASAIGHLSPGIIFGAILTAFLAVVAVWHANNAKGD